MFEKLFERSHAIQRQITGPFLEARLRYLEHCAEHGAAQRTLREIAYYQLIVIDYLDLPHNGTITYAEIEAAANRWAQRESSGGGSKGKSSPLSKTRFIKHSTHWLDFLGCLYSTPPADHPFSAFIKEFALYMREEKGLSQVTIDYRCREVEIYLTELCGEQHPLSDLTITDIDEALLRRINKAGYARRTVQSQAVTLRAFFQYAEQRGWCRSGLASAIRAPRVFRHETLPFSPTWEDVQRLLAGTNGDSPGDIRDRAILLLLSVYGLRSSEVWQLRLEDLDWEHELLHIKRVKQGPRQKFPLTHTVGEAILRYLKEVRPRVAYREVFLTLRAPLRPLTRGAIGRLVSRRWQPLEVALEHHGPHALRHACATRLINQGISLKEIGDQLGHRNLETTRIYAKVDLSHLREVADFNLGGLLCD